MCRFVAYHGQPVFMDEVLALPSLSLVSQAMGAREAKTVVNADGFGFGWYGERPTPGVYRSVLPAWSDPNLMSLASQIRSGLFLAHVRSATTGDVALANCHPFSVGRMVFIHNGQIGGYGRIRRHVDFLIDAAHWTHRHGTTDSEAIFLAALSRGLERDPVTAFATVLADVRRAMIAAAVDAPLRFAAAFSDGERLFAFRWASDHKAPTLYFRREPGGTIVASEPFDDDRAAWTPVPVNAVLTVEGRDRATVDAFEVTGLVVDRARVGGCVIDIKERERAGG